MRCVVGVGSSIASLPTFDVTKISECCKSQRVVQKLPGDYIGELYPANNIALKKVKKVLKKLLLKTQLLILKLKLKKVRK